MKSHKIAKKFVGNYEFGSSFNVQKGQICPLRPSSVKLKSQLKNKKNLNLKYLNEL